MDNDNIWHNHKTPRTEFAHAILLYIDSEFEGDDLEISRDFITNHAERILVYHYADGIVTYSRLFNIIFHKEHVIVHDDVEGQLCQLTLKVDYDDPLLFKKITEKLSQQVSMC